MEKKLKHKKTGEIAYYKDGVLKQGQFSVEIGNEPSSEFWEEVVEYPIGTEVYNSQTNTTYTKKENGWYKPAEKTAYTDEIIRDRKHITVISKSEEKPSKQLIFKTEDGVDIYEGDEVTWLYSHLAICDTRPARSNMVKSFKYFSTREKAQEYIIENKPCLSLKDVRDVYSESYKDCAIFNGLEDLVKSRIK